jgi:hypothetical protein
MDRPVSISCHLYAQCADAVRRSRTATTMQPNYVANTEGGKFDSDDAEVFNLTCKLCVIQFQ